MKLSRVLLGIGLLGGSVVSGCAQEVADADNAPGLDAALRRQGESRAPAALSGRMIVKFRDDGLNLRSSADALGRRQLQNRQRVERVGGQVVHQLGRINAVAAELSAEQVTALRKDDRVAYVEPDPVRKPFLPRSTEMWPKSFV